MKQSLLLKHKGPILVVGTGRSGTCMLLESLRASNSLQATERVEDGNVFIRENDRLPINYLSKCDTNSINNLGQVDRLLDDNPELLILWTIRDLRDCSMSKIYRGQPGNDVGSRPSVDASFDGCITAIKWMSEVYCYISEIYKNRIKLVKMEDLILDYEKTMTDVCKFCGIDYLPEMKNFTSRYRGSIKRTKGARYSGIDKGQVGLYHRRQDVYDGFFMTHDLDLDKLFDNLADDLALFGYEKTRPVPLWRRRR